METPVKIFLVLVTAVAAGGLLYVLTRENEVAAPAPQPQPAMPEPAPAPVQEVPAATPAPVRATAPPQNSWSNLQADITQGILCPNDGKIPCLGAEYMQ